MGVSGPARLVFAPAVRSCEEGNVTPVDDIAGDRETDALCGLEGDVGDTAEPIGGVEVLLESVRDVKAGTGVVSREEDEL